MRGPGRTAHPVDIAASQHRPHHRHPPRWSDHRRRHRSPGRWATRGRCTGPSHRHRDSPTPPSPRNCTRLGETTGYHVAVTWGAQPGTLDAVFITPADPGGQHTAPLTDVYLTRYRAHQSATHANDPQTNTKVSAVRQRLSAWLPDYMVPAHIVVLEAFPLTSSGKIDRKALPAPVFAATPFRAPQTQTEKIVAGVFAEVLGVERVGLDDDFFALGGDSLIATRVSARLQLALGREVPVRYLFDAPTVGDLAEYLDRHRGGPAHPPLRVMPRPERVPLSFAQSRLWFIEQLQGPSPIYNMAVALRLGGRWMPRRWGRRWPMWWAARRVCARCSRRPRGSRSSWWCRLSGPTSAGRSWMPAAGRQTGCRRHPSA